MKKFNFKNLLGIIFFTWAAICQGAISQAASSQAATSRGATSQGADSAALHKIVDDYTQAFKRADAFYAPYFNMEDQLGQFGDYATPEYYDRLKMLFQTTLKKLESLPQGSLGERDRVLARLLTEDLTTSLEGFKYPRELLEFNQMSNRLHAYLDDSSQELTSFPFDSVKHYEAFIERSKGFPAYIEAQINLLKRGIREKIVLSCLVASRTPNSYKDGLEPNIEKNPFWRPITFMPKSFSEADRKQLSDKFTVMIRDRILPGFEKFDLFFKTEYREKCRKTGFGMGELPNGKNWYRYEILNQTNLTLDPKAIHQLGLTEVARLDREIEGIKKELGNKGSLKDFLKSLTQDPKYFFTSAKEMFDAFLTVKAKVSAKIPEYFSLTPKSDYNIVETSNSEDAAGSYNGPTEFIPSGRFIVNTKNLRSVPLYKVTTLSMHETIPGHHFQIALQFEEKDLLTEYQRKIFGSNSFAEGWALYAEYLGNEMGMYGDVMQRLGNRNDELLRAVRLVVDTGIHAYGWSHKRAVAYMTDHLASDKGDIENEVNRYSVWPGQALGYKLGQLKIIELRKQAEKQLGSKFNIRDFHSHVIGEGTLSLGVLETQIKDWIAKTAQAH